VDKRPEGPDPPADPESGRRKLDELDARLRAARGTPGKEAERSGMSHRQTAVAYRVLVDMIAGLLVGGFLGYWLDRWLGWAPFGLVALLVLGFVAGANNAWRTIRNYSGEAANGDKERRLP
jgi:ATP synthase protein I